MAQTGSEEAMDDPQSEDPAEEAAQLRNGADGVHAVPSEDPPDVLGSLPPDGDDLVAELRQRAEALLYEADELAIAWLQDAANTRDEALELRQQAETELAAAQAQVHRERDAAIEAARDQMRAEADLLMQETQGRAADVLEEAVEEGRRRARVESDQILYEAQGKFDDILDRANAEADRIVAEARREETKVLLDARARVDEVRARLIRLYQEMEAAAAERWGRPVP
jgi:ElaB/YqjD/DUF883 family membrane-anchored ribosome-binding protein